MCRSRPFQGSNEPSTLSCVLIYPNTSRVAFASLGFLKVYEMLRSRLETADLAYLPSSEDDDVLSPRQRLLVGLMSGCEARLFDIVAFSVSYENDFVHIPELLLRSGLPPLAAERSDAFPLVVCGGFTMSSNPLPVSDFIDIAVVGEAECAIDPLLEAVAEAKSLSLAKEDLLERISGIDGLYVPSLGERKVRRVWCTAENIAPEPMIQPESHFGDMHLVEMGRGCGRGCRFCAAGNLYRPVRVRDRAAVLSGCHDFHRIGLVGTAVGDHPDLLTILKDLVDRGRQLGISSLRADRLTPEVADLLVKGGIKTLAIAPETGSERLRRRIGKPITQQQIHDAVRFLSEAGIRTVKLYFMIGLPTETEDDVEAVIDLTSELARVRGKSRLTVAAAPFVPKPQTALQWAAFAARDVLRRRMGILRGVSRIRGCSVKLASVEGAWVEAVLARGDRSLGSALLKAVREKHSLKTVLKGLGGIDPAIGLDTCKPLPWDFIEGSVPRKRLLEQYETFRAA